MKLEELKLYLQQYLTDGVVLIVGSGLSASVGLSTMPQLAAYLSNKIPSLLTPNTTDDWKAIGQLLEGGEDLESALNRIEIKPELEELIVELTAKLMAEGELQVARRVLETKQNLPLSTLLKRLVIGDQALPVITTNYDRLIELAAETVDVGVDCSFFGTILGKFDPKASRESMGFASHTAQGAGLKRSYRRHIKLHKPHGSLDWFVCDGFPIRTPFPLGLPRLMVTPGKTKYRKGYEQPFDQHRDAANEAIDRAARFLIIGFGFNDPHLESHLVPRISRGVPCVVLTKQLTPRARAIAASHASVVALSEFVEPVRQGTSLVSGSKEYRYDNINLWSLDSFVSEVF